MQTVIITINDNGKVSVPSNVRMTIIEIANLFGIYHQTAKRTIRAIEKSGVADGDHSMECTVEGLAVYPDYYGLEMIAAVAFRIQSQNAEIFRNWVYGKISEKQQLVIIPANLFQKMELN